MKQYVGLDVSQKETSVCVVNEAGQILLREGLSPIRGLTALPRERGRRMRSKMKSSVRGSSK
jgi:hypothetical protein